MDTARKLAILIVMIIPTFVGAGAVWNMFHNYAPVVIWVGFMVYVAVSIATGKFLTGQASKSSHS